MNGILLVVWYLHLTVNGYGSYDTLKEYNGKSKGSQNSLSGSTGFDCWKTKMRTMLAYAKTVLLYAQL